MLTQLKEKNPDFIAKRKQIEDIKKQQDLMIQEWKDKIEERKQKLPPGHGEERSWKRGSRER